MWKSAYVGVYQLLNWKMHGETLKIQTTLGAHSASYSLGTACYFSRGKAAKAWSWPLTSVQCRSWEWVELYFHSPICLHNSNDTFTSSAPCIFMKPECVPRRYFWTKLHKVIPSFMNSMSIFKNLTKLFTLWPSGLWYSVDWQNSINVSEDPDEWGSSTWNFVCFYQTASHTP